MADATQDKAKPEPKDWRAVIVLVAGLIAVIVIAVVVVVSLPGTVPAGQVNTKGQNAVAIGSAAFTAIATLIAAYFGVKVANNAREDASKARDDAEKRGQANSIRLSHLAGSMDPGKAHDALENAVDEISKLGHGL